MPWGHRLTPQRIYRVSYVISITGENGETTKTDGVELVLAHSPVAARIKLERHFGLRLDNKRNPNNKLIKEFTVTGQRARVYLDQDVKIY